MAPAVGRQYWKGYILCTPFGVFSFWEEEFSVLPWVGAIHCPVAGSPKVAGGLNSAHGILLHPTLSLLTGGQNTRRVRKGDCSIAGAGQRKKSPRYCPGMTATNGHKLGSLRQQNFSWFRRLEVQKSRCPRAVLTSRALGEVPSCLFPLVAAPRIPWMVAVSLQSPPPSSRGLPPVSSLLSFCLL